MSDRAHTPRLQERREKARFRVLAEHGLDLIAEVDDQGRYLWVSPNHREFFGREPKELCGTACFDLVHPDDLPQVASLTANAVATEAPERARCRFRHRDGSWHWLEISGTPYRNEAGEQRRLFVARDVTEWVQLQERLAESESRHRSLLENAHDLIAEHDSAGRRTYVSPRYEAVLGWGVEELLSMPPDGLSHPDDEEARRRITEMVDEEAPEPCLHRMLCRDGGWRWFETIARRLPDTAGPAAVVTISRDVTERLRVQQERHGVEWRMRQAEKLESLGVLAGGFAHDFNNLLVGIQGNAQLALFDVEGDSPVASMLRDIEHASERAAELTQQLLAYAGKRRFTSEYVDLCRLVADMRHRLQSSVPGETLQVLPCDGSPWVQGDEDSLRQVIISFVDNAAEALSGLAGRIEVSCGVVYVDAAYLSHCLEGLEPGEHAWVEVSDDGCGMDESTLGSLFDPFYTTQFQGRGLGLAAALGIVRSHRGTIRVESRPGSGTRMRALFPLASASSDSPEERPQQTTPPERAICVLVVDDDPAVRSVARRMIRRFGYDVTIAHDGDDALACLRKAGDRVSVVVLDVSMPGMDGEATYWALRELTPDLPIIFSTGHSEADAAKLLERKVGVHLLSKPFTLPGLRDAIDRALGIGTD